MIQHDVRDGATEGRNGKDEARGCRRDMHRKVENIHHHRHMYNSTADAEDTGQESNPHAGCNTHSPIICKSGGKLQQVLVLCMRSIPVHEDSHAANEDTVIQVKHSGGESVHYP